MHAWLQYHLNMSHTSESACVSALWVPSAIIENKVIIPSDDNFKYLYKTAKKKIQDWNPTTTAQRNFIKEYTELLNSLKAGKSSENIQDHLFHLR